MDQTAIQPPAKDDRWNWVRPKAVFFGALVSFAIARAPSTLSFKVDAPEQNYVDSNYVVIFYLPTLLVFGIPYAAFFALIARKTHVALAWSAMILLTVFLGYQEIRTTWPSYRFAEIVGNEHAKKASLLRLQVFRTLDGPFTWGKARMDPAAFEELIRDPGLKDSQAILSLEDIRDRFKLRAESGDILAAEVIDNSSEGRPNFKFGRVYFDDSTAFYYDKVSHILYFDHHVDTVPHPPEEQ